MEESQGALRELQEKQDPIIDRCIQTMIVLCW